MPVTIRTILPDDYDAWRVLWQGYLDFYRTPCDEGQARRTHARLCDPSTSGMHGFVAIDSDRRLVGLVHCLFHPSTWTATDYCYLQDLFVEPSARRGGIARALIARVTGLARDRGACRVYWLTGVQNTAARAMYDQVARDTGLMHYRIDLP
jgi:GNAT superfamily N-acetyltransferase